jgi:RNA polymerase sigma-70 factor (ECF subfamily)
MYQRITRAKAKIAKAGIPYRIPGADQLPERLGGVLHVVYLIFNEGHAATAGDQLLDPTLCDEAIRLARLLVELVPDDAEARGLLALLVLTDARRGGRLGDDGRPVVLRDQDRTRWDHDRIDEGRALVEGALRMGRPGPFQVQAAIAALHGEAPTFDETDWLQIAALYRELEALDPSPVVTVNRAVAVAHADGPRAGLAILAELDDDDRLDRYQPLWAARAELLRRAGEADAARAAFDRAIELTDNDAERAALEELRGR